MKSGNKSNKNVIDISSVYLKKNNHAITLIALIITIIILLILAGVTINVLIGDNGLFSIAKNVVEEQNKAIAYEKVNAMLAEYMAKRYTENKRLIDFLNDKKNLQEIQNIIDNNNGTYTIEIDGYNFTIKESDLSIIEISKTGPNPQISNIKITLEDGITVPDDYSVELGTKLKVSFISSITGGQIKSIEPNIPYITNGTELEKEFIIIGSVDGKDYTKTIMVSLKDKYTLKNPEIILSNNEWTKDNIQVTVNWFNNNEKLKKEISLDGGNTYQEYVGAVEVEKNCVIKAKISNDTKEAIGEKVIDKIDKLEPNSFTPTINDLISSTELEIRANTQDKEGTEEYSKSGIKGYIYYVYKDGNLIDKSELISETTWIASGLTVGDSYDIYVESYDNAGNMTKTDKITYTKLEVYKWAEYKANKDTIYSYSSRNVKEIARMELWYYSDGGNVSNFWNKDTGRFDVGERETDVNRGMFDLKSGYWIQNNRESLGVYKLNSDPVYLDNYRFEFSATYYYTEKEERYNKIDEFIQYVTSNDPEAYPDKDGKGNNWYEKVSN